MPVCVAPAPPHPPLRPHPPASMQEGGRHEVVQMSVSKKGLTSDKKTRTQAQHHRDTHCAVRAVVGSSSYTAPAPAPAPVPAPATAAAHI